MNVPIRVALLDDHAVVRGGYRRLIELEGDIVVCAEYGTAEEAFTQLTRDDGGSVDVLVVDLSLPGMGGLHLLRRLQERLPELKTLVFTMHDSPATVRSCLHAGTRGFITKNSPPEVMIEALRGVAGGEVILSESLAGADAASAPHARLSAREFDVLQRLVVGQTVEQIAASLHLNAKTISNYQTDLRRKFGAASAIELLRRARSLGLVPSSPDLLG